MLSDIEIAQKAEMKPITEIGESIGIPATEQENYGHYKAKVSLKFTRELEKKPNGKLILVTAISPTPAGEGKTTTTVGLGQALSQLGKKTMICLREPSLGPCMGIKAAQQAAVIRRSSRWKISIFISRAISMRSPLHTIFLLPWWTTTSSRETYSVSIRAASYGTVSWI